MKAKISEQIKRKIKERLRIPLKDPTLEGKDETKVGRVQEKIGDVDCKSLPAKKRECRLWL
jgi:hypothetical protein